MLRPCFFLAAFLPALFSAGILFSTENEIRLLAHGEYGRYNKVYKDLQYKDNPATTFDVPMINAGFEYRRKDAAGNVAGGGLVSTHIDGGSVWNVNHIEKQPRTSLLIPYLFTGIDNGSGALELGIGWYLTIERMEPSLYFNPDGTEKVALEGGERVRRTKSYALVNIAMRIFPEDGFHLKFRYARERFNGIDSLCNAAVVLPFGMHAFEIYVSLPSDWIRRYMPQSNQRFGIAYFLKLERIKIGLNAGYLSFNHRGGGDGNMPLFDGANFSIGTEIELTF